MQCPNCRHVENGQWLYANGCRQRDELILEDIINEEEYDVFAEVSEIRYPHDLMVSNILVISCGSGYCMHVMLFKFGMFTICSNFLVNGVHIKAHMHNFPYLSGDHILQTNY
jgi:hypothetical protein